MLFSAAIIVSVSFTELSPQARHGPGRGTYPRKSLTDAVIFVNRDDQDLADLSVVKTIWKVG
jgi:hypothetical protein